MFKYYEKYDCSNRRKPAFFSCKWMQHGIVFFKDKITHCPHCGQNGDGYTLIKNDCNGNLNLKHLFKQKREYTRLSKQGFIHDNCLDCPLLEEKYAEDWESEDDYIDNIYISNWANCNCKCIYCYTIQNTEERPYSLLPLIEEMLKLNHLRRGGNIIFGGGEPTLLPDFEEIIRLLLDYRFYDLKIETSGIKYSPIIERGVKEGRLKVILSVDSGCAETYQKIKQVPCYDIVRENARRYAMSIDKRLHAFTPDFYYQSLFCVNTKFIIIPGINDTEEEVENWVKADSEAGIYTSVVDIEENWFKENENNIPQSIYDFLHTIKKLSVKYKTYFAPYERVANILKNNPDKAPWFIEENS